MTIHLVVNPASGGGRAALLEPWVTRRLRDAGHEVETTLTTSWQDADQTLAGIVGRCSIDPGTDTLPDTVVVMGGDGMVHLGLNRLAGTGLRLGVVPSGTGNDFAGSVGLPSRVRPAVAAVLEGEAIDIDLAEVTGAVEGGHVWVGCVVSTGYDAVVNRLTNAMTTKFGPLSYGWVALTALARFTPRHYRLVIDGVPRNLDAMLVAVGNGGHFGGGMTMCPGASVLDGMLDVTIIHRVPRRVLLSCLPVLYTDRVGRLPFVETLRARSVEVDGEDMFAMADGEEIGGLPLTVTARPRAVTLLGVRR